MADEVELMSVTPLRHAPLPSAAGELLEDVRGKLSACRRAWWTNRSTVCLTNKWVLKERRAVTVLAERRPEAVQIKDAGYDPEGNYLRILFRDGTEFTIEAGSGMER